MTTAFPLVLPNTVHTGTDSADKIGTFRTET